MTIANRVAAKYLKAQGEEEAAGTVAKLPGSETGMQMFKSMMRDLDRAYRAEDEEGFGKALETLWNAHERLNPRK